MLARFLPRHGLKSAVIRRPSAASVLGIGHYASTYTSSLGGSIGVAPPRDNAQNMVTTQSRTIRRYSAGSSPSELRKTPLFELHTRNGAKMVPFGGFSMPVQYGDLSVGDSHAWTREKASIFDVSHM